MCTIRLEQLCYQRAWWFRSFREVLATGIRVFAFAYRVRPDQALFAEIGAGMGGFSRWASSLSLW